MMVVETLLPAWSNAGAFFVSIIVILIYYWYQRPLLFPRGPRGFPFVGVVPYLGKNPETTLSKWSRKYGPVMSVRMGREDWVVFGNYESVYESFVKGGHVFSGRPYIKLLSKLTESKGLAMIDYNPTWKSQRKFGLITLRGFGVGKKSLEERIVEEIDVLNRSILEKEGTPFDISDILRNAIMNIICNITTGKRFGYDDEFFKEIKRIFSKWFSDPANSEPFLTMVFAPFLRRIPPFLQKYREIKNDIRTLLGMFQVLVKEHRETFDENNIRDFIDAFLLEAKMHTDPSFKDERQLLQYVRELFEAGTETTVGTMLWAVLCLVRHPDAQSKLRKEIFDVIGPVSIPSLSDRSAMPFTCAFIQEVLRYRTVIPLSVPHKTTDTVNFGGFIIPKGTTVVSNLWAVHNDPDVWNEPSKFKPERHLDHKGNFVQSNHVIPFSIGPRRCLGEQLARMEIFIILVSLVQKFKFLPDSDETDLPEIDKGLNGAAFVPLSYKIIAKPI